MDYLKGIQKNILGCSLFIFLVVFSLIHIIKPNVIYTKNGLFREFGIGYRTKTVLPMWLIVLFISVLSYLSVLYFLIAPKITF